MTDHPPPERGIAASVDQALHSVTCDANRRNEHGKFVPCTHAARYAVTRHDCSGLLLCADCLQQMFATLYPSQLAICAECRAQFAPSLAMITKVDALS